MSMNRTNNSGHQIICDGLQFHEYAATSAVTTNVTIIIVINSLIAAVAVIACCLFLVVVSKKANLQTPPTLLLARLALADILIGLVVIPLYNAINYYHAKGVHLCTLSKINAYLLYFLLFCSTTAVVFICMDRFIAVALPLVYRRPLHHRRIRRVLGFIWACWGVFLAFPYNGFLSVDEFHLLISALLLGSLAIICVFYAAIVRKLRLVAAAVKNNQVIRISRTDLSPKLAHAKALQMRRKVCTTVFITCAFFVSYLPRLARLIIRKISGDSLANTYILGCWTTTVIFMNSAVNPIIFLFRLKDARTATLEFLRGIFKRNRK